MEHSIKCILKRLIRRITSGFSFNISNPKERFQELGIVETISIVNSILNNVTNTFNFSQSLCKKLYNLFTWLAEIYKLGKIDETLKHNHHVFLMHCVVLIKAWSIVFEMLMQLCMIDREQWHRCIEVFFVLVKEQVHHIEIVLKFCWVLLLSEKLHLCLNLLFSLSLFKFFLCISGFSFLLFILFLLFIIHLFLSFLWDWLRLYLIWEEIFYPLICKLL